MEALGAWVAVHEPLLTKELERSEKAEQAAAAEAACEAAKQELCPWCPFLFCCLLLVDMS